MDIIERLRTNIENLTLRSTFIVGFPTEAKVEFEELLEFIEEYKFDRAGAFEYSREEGTVTSTIEGQIHKNIKEERLETFTNLQSEISYNKNYALIGTIQKAIIEGFENEKLYARLSSQAPEVDGIT